MLRPENKATNSILIKNRKNGKIDKQTKKQTKKKKKTKTKNAKGRIKFTNKVKIHILSYSRHL